MINSVGCTSIRVLGPLSQISSVSEVQSTGTTATSVSSSGESLGVAHLDLVFSLLGRLRYSR